MNTTTETILAIASPPGRGGVGIVRVSGPRAYLIALEITQLKTIKPRYVKYCPFYHVNGEILDEGLLLYFKAPNSFTGEDVIEFQCHGAPIVQDALLQRGVQLGARLARPGEFSERAFLNNKIDLTQAEAIADLINASSQTAARMAMQSLQGEFSKKIHEINEQIIQLRLYVEAAIDFPEEEIDFLNDGKIATMAANVLKSLDILRTEAMQGTLLREGLTIVIAGAPNAGKSTLINKLARRDVAIVSTIAGTTRDVMREPILLDDLPLHIVDTAGLHESHNEIEIEGMKRAWSEIQRADCVLLVTDINADIKTATLQEEIREKLPTGVPIIHVFNKIDIQNNKPKSNDNAVYLSAKSGHGLELLKTKIKETVGYQPLEGKFLARRRHLDAIDRARTIIDEGLQQLINHRAGELLAEDLRTAHLELCSITGEFSSDDLLGKIFSSFCIGK